jgi:hypothetical protein
MLLTRRTANSATRRTFARTTRSSPEPLRRPARSSEQTGFASGELVLLFDLRKTQDGYCSESRRASREAPSVLTVWFA